MLVKSVLFLGLASSMLVACGNKNSSVVGQAAVPPSIPAPAPAPGPQPAPQTPPVLSPFDEKDVALSTGQVGDFRGKWRGDCEISNQSALGVREHAMRGDDHEDCFVSLRVEQAIDHMRISTSGAHVFRGESVRNNDTVILAIQGNRLVGPGIEGTIGSGGFTFVSQTVRITVLRSDRSQIRYANITREADGRFVRIDGELHRSRSNSRK